jgi:hypothetical protein
MMESLDERRRKTPAADFTEYLLAEIAALRARIRSAIAD